MSNPERRPSAVCPGLVRREDGTFFCTYAGRPVNPYAMPCFLDYITCPVYIRYRAEAKAKPVEKVPEAKPQVAEEKVVEKPVEVVRDFEDLVIDDLRNLLSEYEGKVQELDTKWRDYEQSVLNTRGEFDKVRILIEHHLELLRRTIMMYEFNLKELEYRRSLGILDEEQYSKLREEINNKLDRLRKVFEEFTNRFDNIVSSLVTHIKRVLLLVPSPEIGKMRLVLARLDELLREGKITYEVYDKLKRELESLVSGV